RPSSFGFRHSLRASSRLCDWKRLLLLRFFRFVFPFLYADVRAAEREEFFFVVNHFFASGSGQRVIFHQEDRFFGTNLLAIAAEDAAEHIDLELLWYLLRIRPVGGRTVGTGRNDSDRLGRADEFTELAADAFGVAFLVLHEIG